MTSFGLALSNFPRKHMLNYYEERRFQVILLLPLPGSSAHLFTYILCLLPRGMGAMTGPKNIIPRLRICVKT